MQITFQATAEERSRASSAELHQKLGGGSRVKTWFVLLIIVAVIIFRVQREVSRSDLSWFIPLFLVIWVITFVMLRRQRRKEPRDPTVVIDLQETEVRVARDGGSSIAPWSTFAKFAEDPEFFLLYFHGGKTYLFLPKRAITGGPVAEQQLREILRAKIGQRADGPDDGEPLL